MISNRKVLAVVPARGGSKGIPRKNLVPLNGKPLLAYTAESARKSKYIDRAVLSTEDEEIARIGRAQGLEVPFMRAQGLAQDDTPTIDVIRDAVLRLQESGWMPEIVVVLEPTSPLRTSRDIDLCLEMLVEHDADSAISVEPVPSQCSPFWAIVQDEEGFGRWAMGGAEPIPNRQSLPAAYHRNGAVYAVLSRIIIDEGSLYGSRMKLCIMKPGSSLDINTHFDLALAERLIKKRSQY